MRAQLFHATFVLLATYCSNDVRAIRTTRLLRYATSRNSPAQINFRTNLTDTDNRRAASFGESQSVSGFFTGDAAVA